MITNSHQKKVITVAVFLPVRSTYNYTCTTEITLGSLVLVRFGKQKIIGMVADINNYRNNVEYPYKLLEIIEKVDQGESLISEQLLFWLSWCARYYQHPIGDVIAGALPTWLRKKDRKSLPKKYLLKINNEYSLKQINEILKKAPKQKEAFSYCVENGPTLDAQSTSLSKYQSAIRALIKRDIIQKIESLPKHLSPYHKNITPPKYALSIQQQENVAEVSNKLNSFNSFLLHGITGSGKTEVYIELTSNCLSKKHQVLVLVPEVSLTPQLLSRFKERFPNQVATYHSQMGDAERYKAWLSVKNGEIPILLGTRSAVFQEFKNLALIIIDEEHDASYKQQTGFRYHARSIAIKRASLLNIPILLGSATPSLESWFLAKTKKFTLLRLPQRFGESILPRIHLIDINQHKIKNGLTKPLEEAISLRLEKKEQTILFVNRRGFAPTTQCSDCGWQVECPRCSVLLVCHHTKNSFFFRCHHCNFSQTGSSYCHCGASLFFAGFGTQRIEKELSKKFPNARILRLDKDNASNLIKMDAYLNQIKRQEVDIIVGTQIITKGHDFENVTLVGVLAADQGLYSNDFRSEEYSYQKLVQVSGRAGRKKKKGEVYIQTIYPKQRQFKYIQNQYDEFANQTLEERKQTNLPPFSHLIIWRAESHENKLALQFLHKIYRIGQELTSYFNLEPNAIMMPTAAPIEKRDRKIRAQLIIRHDSRNVLHHLMKMWIEKAQKISASNVKWSIDIDPIDIS